MVLPRQHGVWLSVNNPRTAPSAETNATPLSDYIHLGRAYVLMNQSGLYRFGFGLFAGNFAAPKLLSDFLFKSHART